MKKTFCHIFIILLFTACTSQKNLEDKSSTEQLSKNTKKEFYKSGEIKSEVIYIDINNKISKHYYKDGSLFIEKNYKKDKLHGKFTIYYPVTGISKETFLLLNKLTSECVYKKDILLDTLNYEYYNTKVIQSNYSNQKKLFQATYIDGKMENNAIFYYKNGNIQKFNTFKNNFENGIEKYFYEDGTLKYEIFKSNNDKNGVYKDYYKNASLANYITYKKNKMHGVKKSFYYNGKLEYIGTIKNGIWDKELKTYYDNGNLKSINYYKNGKIDGIYKEFSKNGLIKETVLYSKGVIIKE